MDCPECLFELDLLLLCEAPATLEEEAILSQLPAVSPKDLLARSTPRVTGDRQ